MTADLDARSYRLPSSTEMMVFEIDQLQVIKFNISTLAALGARPTTNFRAAPIDLRHAWPLALCQADLDPERPTAWLAKSLLVFLPSQDQDSLLDNITELSTYGSRLITETSLDAPEAIHALEAANKLYEHGLAVVLDDNLAYLGECHDVTTHLDMHGWNVMGTRLEQFLVDNELPVPPTKERPGPAVSDKKLLNRVATPGKPHTRDSRPETWLRVIRPRQIATLPNHFTAFGYSISPKT